jgi:hypothetical protein
MQQVRLTQLKQQQKQLQQQLTQHSKMELQHSQQLITMMLLSKLQQQLEILQWQQKQQLSHGQQ